MTTDSKYLIWFKNKFSKENTRLIGYENSSESGKSWKEAQYDQHVMRNTKKIKMRKNNIVTNIIISRAQVLLFR